MGLGCGKAFLPTEDDVVLGSRQQRRDSPRAKENAKAEGGAAPETSPAHEEGQPSQTSKKNAKKKEDADPVAELLKRAKAGGTEEKVAAALAASPKADAEDDSDGETDQRLFMKLLGGSGSPTAAAPAASARASAPNGAASQGPTAASSSSSRASIPAGYSVAAMRAAARAGVPLPLAGEREEEAYGLLDEYVDDLLGVPEAQRPSDRKRPAAEASFRGTTPDIIYNDGRRGPPLQSMPGLEEDSPAKVPADPRPSLVPPPGSKAAPKTSDEFMSGVIHGWASIDAVPKAADPRLEAPAAAGAPPPAPPGPPPGASPQAVTLKIVEERGPAPKRKAASRTAK